MSSSLTVLAATFFAFASFFALPPPSPPAIADRTEAIARFAHFLIVDSTSTSKLGAVADSISWS